MNITLKRNYGYELIFEADNIKVVEDIEERTYPKDESGKSIINLNPKRDIQTSAIEQFANVLQDMIYYRESDFDSSDLIKSLFDKLPSSKVQSLITELYNTYE